MKKNESTVIGTKVLVFESLDNCNKSRYRIPIAMGEITKEYFDETYGINIYVVTDENGKEYEGTFNTCIGYALVEIK